MKTYNISGKVVIDIDVDVEANSEEEALKVAKEILHEDLSLYEYNGKFDLIALKIEED